MSLKCVPISETRSRVPVTGDSSSESLVSFLEFGGVAGGKSKSHTGGAAGVLGDSCPGEHKAKWHPEP